LNARLKGHNPLGATTQNGTKLHFPGANPTIVSYNASVVKIYKATSGLARFEKKIIFFPF
jgi:hypothetical protein